MTKKIEIAQMTMEEIIAYAERVKQNNRGNITKFYNNNIQIDPEKYELRKQKCKVANQKQYYKKRNTPVTEIS